tara:strand:+ start:999 stop:1367 length:369 start_codon:yes stop_codon:yes gene_type:complete
MTFATKKDRRIEIKTELSQLAAREKELRQELEPLDAQILEDMRELGVESIKVNGHTLTINTAIHPTLTSKEEAMPYIAEHKLWEMIPAKINGKAFVEHLETGGSIPGVSSYEKTTLSVRKLP